MIEILPVFIPRFLAGFLVNLEIALLSLLVGLVLGVPLALMLVADRVSAAIAAFVVGILRAAPTFVVMFFLVNAIPQDFAPFGLQLGNWGFAAVVFSQAVYAVAYVADNGVVALRALHAKDTATAVIFLPNLARAFCVLLMSSGVAAAVGIPEALFITIREAERMPDLGDRALLFLVVMIFFSVLMQTAFAVINVLRHQLGRLLDRAGADA